MAVNITSYKPVTQIIDLLNGSSSFVIDNPYFALKGSKALIDKFIEYKDLTKDKEKKGASLKMPSIMYRKSDDEAFTPFFAIRPDNGGSASTKIKLASQYDPTKPLSVYTKIFVSFGNLTDELKLMATFDYQIRQAYEMLMVVKLLDLNISSCKTDDDVIKMITDLDITVDGFDSLKSKFTSDTPFEITKGKSKDDTDEFGEADSDESSAGVEHFIQTIDPKTLTIQLNKMKSTREANPVFRYYKNKLQPLQPLFTVAKFVNKETSETTLTTSAKLTFVLTIDKNHQGSTTRLHGRKETIMTHSEYQAVQKKRLIAVLCFKFDCDIRKYGQNIKPVNSMRGTVKSIGYKEMASTSHSYLEGNYDDFIDDDAEINETENGLLPDENF